MGITHGTPGVWLEHAAVHSKVGPKTMAPVQKTFEAVEDYSGRFTLQDKNTGKPIKGRRYRVSKSTQGTFGATFTLNNTGETDENGKTHVFGGSKAESYDFELDVSVRGEAIEYNNLGSLTTTKATAEKNNSSYSLRLDCIRRYCGNTVKTHWRYFSTWSYVLRSL